MKLSDLKVNVEKIELGDWVDNIPDMGSLRLKVKGLGNKAYSKLQDEIFSEFRRRGQTMTPEERDQIQGRLFAETILFDWDGLEDEADNPIPYDKKLAIEMLSNPAFREFKAAVNWAADVVSRRRDNGVKEEAGNLLPPSDGG